VSPFSALLCGSAVAQDTASAAVPALLAAVASKAALAFMSETGRRSGTVPEQAAVLAEEVLKAMTAARFRFGLALMIALTVLGAGTGMILKNG
jgi:hypothetical protein